MKSDIVIEAAAFTANSAMQAVKGGADRIEICSGYSEGGLTPSAGILQLLRDTLSTPIHVMIRPRIGDFVYNPDEIEVIIKDIEFCKSLKMEGIVVGILTREGKVNKEAVEKIMQHAYPMTVNFHRAFDFCINLHEALGDLIACGVTRVLTSGSRASAYEGRNTIASLVKQAGKRIKIIAGGGINAKHAKELIACTGIDEIHLSGKTRILSDMKRSHVSFSLANPSELSDEFWYECNPETIKSIRKSFGN
jgi:copper homeostasis protein